jgi:hypothetical protein
MAAAARRAELDAVALLALAPRRDARQVLREPRVEARGLRRVELDQRVVRGRRDRRLERGLLARTADPHVALVAAVDSVHRLEDRHVDDRQRAAGAARAELLAVDAALAGGDRSVIEAARVDRDLVPAPHRVEARRGLRLPAARPLGRALERGAEHVAHPAPQLVAARGCGGQQHPQTDRAGDHEAKRAGAHELDLPPDHSATP